MVKSKKESRFLVMNLLEELLIKGQGFLLL